MKNPAHLITLTAVLALAPLGCSPSDSSAGSSGGSTSASIAGFDLSKVQNALASASSAVQEEFKRIMGAVNGGDYSAALNQLQQFAGNPSLSADQKGAIEGLIAQLKAKGSDVLKGASETASKAMDQAKEAASKAASQAGDAANKAAAQATDAATKATSNLLPK